MKELTERQRKTMLFVQEYIEKNGYPPSHREVGRGIGTAHSSYARVCLLALEKKGFLRINLGVVRGMKVLKRLEAEGELEPASAGAA